MTEQTPEEHLNYDELELIGHVLLGAAYADGEADGTEVDTICDILEQLAGIEGELPESVSASLEAFKPESFDLAATCAKLVLATPDDRRALLALVAEVTDADDIHTCDEDDYIKLVAKHIGSAPEEYADLTMDLIFISSVKPPPIPTDA